MTCPIAPTVLLAAIFIIAILLVGCAATPEDQAADHDPVRAGRTSLIGEWDLFEIRGEPVTARVSDEELRQRPSLLVDDDGRTTGMGGVNRWNGGRIDDGGRDDGFIIGPIASTKMAGPPRLMALEDDFFAALVEVTTFDAIALAEGQLVLRDDQGRALLRFSSVTGR